MNSILSKKYAFLGKKPIKEQKQKRKFSISSITKNNTLQIVLFCAIMAVIGYLAVEKIIPDIIPYSWNSAFASTFSYAISAVGFCLLMGYSGLASLGTGGFIGVGMLSVYYIMKEANLPFLLAVFVAIAVAVVLGIIVGFISLRIEGIYLVILTLGLSEILRQVFIALGDKFSLSYSKFPEIFGFKIIRTYSLYVVLVFLAIVMIVISNLINSPTGRAMLAMKNSTAAAQAMGISLMKYRLLAFVICTLCASVSGTLLMMVLRTATASQDTGIFALLTSLNSLAAVIIGGVIGSERARHGRAAGMRTHILVCLGATLTAMTSVFLSDKMGGDAMRISAQVVSGIGFLGVGMIIIKNNMTLLLKL